jgi:hypothetical protein
MYVFIDARLSVTRFDLTSDSIQILCQRFRCHLGEGEGEGEGEDRIKEWQHLGSSLLLLCRLSLLSLSLLPPVTLCGLELWTVVR